MPWEPANTELSDSRAWHHKGLLRGKSPQQMAHAVGRGTASSGIQTLKLPGLRTQLPPQVTHSGHHVSQPLDVGPGVGGPEHCLHPTGHTADPKSQPLKSLLSHEVVESTPWPLHRHPLMRHPPPRQPLSEGRKGKPRGEPPNCTWPAGAPTKVILAHEVSHLTLGKAGP